MEFVIVKLYYPNKWRQNVGDLASIEDKRFNWFLCSNRYEDAIPGVYVAEVSAGTKFYDDVKGINYILMEPAKLLIIEQKELFSKPPEDVIKKLKSNTYQGLALTIDCANPEGSIICPEALFGFVKGKLKIDKKDSSGCPIIQYSKSNYKCIKTKIPDFPSPTDIDDILAAGYPLSVVCKVLYEDIVIYTSNI